MRDARLEIRKVPNPVKVTLWPFERLLVTVSKTASIAIAAVFLVMSAFLAAISIKSPFVMAMEFRNKSQ